MEGLNQELTLDEEKPEGNVLEFPTVLEAEDEVVVADEEELAAAAIGTRSIDEILGIKPEENEAAEQTDEEAEENQDELFIEPQETASESEEKASNSENDDDEESLA